MIVSSDWVAALSAMATDSVKSTGMSVAEALQIDNATPCAI
jgi:hypothetical protein